MNTVVLQESGFLFAIELSDAYWTRLVLARTQYEPEVKWFIELAAPHYNTFLDGGANKGYWTCFATTLFDEVISVEAADHPFEALEGNVKLQGERARAVRMVHAAVAARSGETVSLTTSRWRHGASFINGLEPSWKSLDDDTVRTELVPTKTIDELTGGRPCLIKLDVEGAEIAAMSGAPETLAAGAAVIIEDHGANSGAPIVAYLLDGGFDVYQYTATKAVSVPTVDAAVAVKKSPHVGYNFFAVQPDTAIGNALRQASRRPW